VRLVWGSGAAALALFCGIAAYLAPLEPNILALQFAFSPKAFGAVVHAWSGEPLHRFRMHLVADGALLLSYGIFGHGLATRTRLFAHWPRRRQRFVAWMLPLAAAFDAAENLLHLWLTAAPRFGLSWPYGLAAACASAKWLLLVGFALSVCAALAHAARDPGRA
jgi:hypothetical protein